MRRQIRIPCAECGHVLKFIIENDVIIKGDGRIAVNVPCTVCPNCVDSALDKVADPPGLICINGLSGTLAEELLQNFEFMRSPSEASKFFRSLFPSL